MIDVLPPPKSVIDAQETCLRQLRQVLSIFIEIECCVDTIHQQYFIKVHFQHNLNHSEAMG